MPCTGPSQERAYEKGEIAFEKVLALLHKEYGCCAPFPDGPPPGYPAGFAQKSQDKWEHLEAQLKETLQELVWTYDAAMW